ncbi:MULTISPECIES: hypothetical protein [unclassified Bradyrhizobium]|uniref:hypothetical protein n=1 Tax=unclassified Bradyrhizobium TaxID=2631580 RepID=UPI00247B2CA4|nr:MULTISPECIES: hypothetical protein [unclassified Bradyrhizobium]WGS23338.1 hypothetical protein MTX22_17935 [Bradyrhizobium sp. ISRA463]WGS30348.1 hypothetical protein MTX19_15660 [Bradyrhizobium sp. ISRA464]
MLKDGTYAAWFRTPLGEGTGIVHFADGKLWGRDSIMLYSGTYEVAGDRFSAIVTTKRHTEGHATVFGVDDLVLRLEGLSAGAIATCTGTADQVPGVPFEATLIPSEGLPAEPKANAPTPAPKFDASKLPKLPSRSSHR